MYTGVWEAAGARINNCYTVGCSASVGVWGWGIGWMTVVGKDEGIGVLYMALGWCMSPARVHRVWPTLWGEMRSADSPHALCQGWGILWGKQCQVPHIEPYCCHRHPSGSCMARSQGSLQTWNSIRPGWQPLGHIYEAYLWFTAAWQMPVVIVGHAFCVHMVCCMWSMGPCVAVNEARDAGHHNQ